MTVAILVVIFLFLALMAGVDLLPAPPVGVSAGRTRPAATRRRA